MPSVHYVYACTLHMGHVHAPLNVVGHNNNNHSSYALGTLVEASLNVVSHINNMPSVYTMYAMYTHTPYGPCARPSQCGGSY